MPIYEYHCNNCNKDFEYLIIGSAKPNCPTCDSKKVKKQMSACGFVSKGNNGASVKTSASSSSCESCAASSCAGCGH